MNLDSRLYIHSNLYKVSARWEPLINNNILAEGKITWIREFIEERERRSSEGPKHEKNLPEPLDSGR